MSAKLRLHFVTLGSLPYLELFMRRVWAGFGGGLGRRFPDVKADYSKSREQMCRSINRCGKLHEALWLYEACRETRSARLSRFASSPKDVHA